MCKYSLLGLYNVVCVYIFGANPIGLANQLVYFSLKGDNF